MKAALCLVVLSLALMAPTPGLSYTYQQKQQVQEKYGHTGEYVKNLFDGILNAVYGSEEDTDDDDLSDDDGTIKLPTGPSAVEDVDDDDDDDDDVTSQVTQTETEDDDDSDDSDDDDVTTMATPTEPEDDDDDDVTTQATPTEPEDDKDDDDDDVTTVSPPSPTPSVPATTRVPNLCDDCDFRHGVGYNPYPGDCTLFVQCYQGKNGEALVDSVQSCSHGLYWDQKKLTCDFPHNVQCVDDICLGAQKTKVSKATCRGYWDCTSGTAVAKCCDKGYTYNPYTSQCYYDSNCDDDCLSSTTEVECHCDGMRAVPGDLTVYEVKTDDTWTRMPCPHGLGFTTNPCGCNIRLNVTKEPVCTPELHLPFNSADIRDMSGKGVWVENEGVTVVNGEAVFNGSGSRLMVTRFSNAWWGSKVYVYLRFKSKSGGSGPRQALVSNGDCQVRSSLAMCAGSQGVDFYAETYDSALPANFTVFYGASEGEGWQEAWYQLDNNQLYGYLNERMTQASAKGVLESRQRGLVIGRGGGCADFDGYIDELTVYLCRPDGR